MQHLRYILIIIVLGLTQAMADYEPARVTVDLSSRQKRALTSQEFATRFNHQQSLARNRARQLGWLQRGQDSRGKIFELLHFDNRRINYYQTLNLNAGISTAADLVRYSVPFNLDGSGVAAGVWDAGAVRPTHQELWGRTAVMDFASPDNHATHVGGTIGAAGIKPDAIGMSPGVQIRSYDWNQDFAEIIASAATQSGESNAIYISNHSYGLVKGWARGSFSSGYNGVHWFGESLADREDRAFGQYSYIAYEIDNICHNAPYYLSVWAAGNERNTTDNKAPSNGNTFYYFDGQQGLWKSKIYSAATDPFNDYWKNGGYDTLSAATVAKNTLTVGAVEDAQLDGVRNLSKATMAEFSSWGPTDDGRIKPDLVANGYVVYSSTAGSDTSYGYMSGTSMAAPNASGSAVLLIQLYRSLFDNDDMRAATLKGLLLHTADDLGNPGPDYKYGWGLLNTLAAARLIAKHAAHPQALYMKESQLTTIDSEHIYRIYWSGKDEIIATLTWSDPPGSARTGLNDRTPVLVNDLDLRLTAPDGITVYYPYRLDPDDPEAHAVTGNNVRDNTEQIRIPSPSAQGVYRLSVSYKNTLKDGLQTYSLFVSGQTEGNQPFAPAMLKIR